ncbi:Zinc finger CCCH domain-containing protein 45 [Cardamine amara subsp. amara]|uniref:Zinc finger CCCH domain-containing protein 45 n=1 Tax=Cardamine amara subsp. amara TaxID=228776 RepID=A0ABD1AWX6_CARAN
MNNVQASVGLGMGHQTCFNFSYPTNLNRAYVTGGPKLVVKQVMAKNYVKNLIREHGKDNHETNQNNSQTRIVNKHINDNNVQKQCNYFGIANGYRNGYHCRFVHDGFRPNIGAEALRDKRWKFGSYEKNSG